MTINRGTVLAINAICFDRPKVAHELQVVLEIEGDLESAIHSYCTHQFVKSSAKETLLNRYRQFDLARLEEQLNSFNINTVFYGENAYPSLLASIAFPPLVLFYKGSLSALSKPCLAVVGPRKMSPYGKQVTQFFSRHLSHGFVLVSGLALGVDTVAHETALKENKQTIAVLAHGLDTCYPSHNLKLFYEIEQNGCLISEFPPGVDSLPHHFPQRNRIVSGLCIATLVTEGTAKSGSLITARYALDADRDVFAVPGDIFSETSSGVHHLIKDGAALVTHPNDIFDAYSTLFPSKPNREEAPIRDLSPPEKVVLKALHFMPQHVDALRVASRLETPLLLSTLMQLDMEGLIESHPGNCYSLKA